MSIFPAERIGVTEISTTTGSANHAGTTGEVDVDLFDINNNCCQLPLDNPGDDRDLGATDVYDGATLNACDKFTPHGGLQVKVNLAGDNAWELDSVKVKFDDDSYDCCRT